MPTYSNGYVPLNRLIKDGEHYFFPGTYSRWKEFRNRVHDETGVWLTVTPGPNAYRSYSEQVRLKKELGNYAAYPGTSSHGGIWTGSTKGHSGLPTWVSGRESGAVDVYNWQSVPWSVFDKHAKAVGFITDIVVPTEKWHIVDLKPWQVPSFGSAATVQEDDMNAEQERKLDQLSADVKALSQAVSWLRLRVGGSTKAPSITNVLRGLATKDPVNWIKSRIGGTAKGGASLTSEIRQIRNYITGKETSNDLD